MILFFSFSRLSLYWTTASWIKNKKIENKLVVFGWNVEHCMQFGIVLVIWLAEGKNWEVMISAERLMTMLGVANRIIFLEWFDYYSNQMVVNLMRIRIFICKLCTVQLNALTAKWIWTTKRLQWELTFAVAAYLIYAFELKSKRGKKTKFYRWLNQFRH